MNHVLAAFLGLAAILSSAPAEDHVAEYQKILHALPADGASADPAELASGARQLWALLGRRAASILDAEPGLSADRLASRLLALEDEAAVPSERRALGVSAVELGPAGHSAYALAVSHGAVGTVLVVAPTPRGYGVVWSLSDQAEASFARKNRTPLDFQFGAWALGAKGKRHSTLGGIVHALPSSPEGHARFYVDAIARAGIGQERQGQISVWEWREGRVECLDIKSYWTTSTANRIVSDGDVLRVHVLERFKTMVTCGACESTEEIWTLHVMDSGIAELSRIPLVPELRLVDELLFRLQSHQSVAELAATDVEERLAPLMADASEPDAEGFVAMLADWKVTAQGDSTEVELQLDGLPRLAFTIGAPAGQSYVQAVKVLD